MKNPIADYGTGKLVDLANPEEKVRQEYEHILIDAYGYPKSNLDIEVKIPRGSGFFPDFADIVIYDGDGTDPAGNIVGIVETKRPSKLDGLAQLKSYMTATSAIWGVWTNGDDIAYICRDPNNASKIKENNINNIPVFGQTIEDIGKLRKSELDAFTSYELKSAFRRILKTLYANTNISRREKLGGEMIKLIFAKLIDEKTYLDRPPAFRCQVGENPGEVKGRIVSLFEQARNQLKNDGVFEVNETINLDAKSVAWVVGQLEMKSLMKTDTDIVGDAFEIFAESKLVGEKGEFFTPRNVVKLAIRLLDPEPHQVICDPACGSGGFLIHAMKYMWAKMEADPQWAGSPAIDSAKRDVAAQNLFGIDKENDLVKIAKAHMSIAGDGRSNIIHENALHSINKYGAMSKKKFAEDGDFRKFDIVLTNPPYGTKTKILESDARNFKLGHKWKKKDDGWEKGKEECARDPYILFIERCFEMTADGGKLALVLPETVFHGPSLGYIRQYVLECARIIAIVDIPHNTFRPHCNAKTCLVILEKTKEEQGNIVMAVPKEIGHNHEGKPVFKPNSNDIWDDLDDVIREIEVPSDPNNVFVFVVNAKDFNKNIWIPKYYLPDQVKKINNTAMKSIGYLMDKKIIDVWDGHGSPKAEFKGKGKIPYIRVADIVNWEMYRNPVTGIPEAEYSRILKKQRRPEAGDIILVRRGSFRIGTVAMASPRDSEVLLTKELLTIRVIADDNELGIDPFYLLFLLSSSYVQEQIPNKVFVDTTLPNLGDRWKEIILPIHTEQKEREEISSAVQKAIKGKWRAQKEISDISRRFGEIVT